MVTLVADRLERVFALAETTLAAARSTSSAPKANWPFLSKRWTKHGLLSIEDAGRWIGSDALRGGDEDAFARGVRRFRQEIDSDPAADPFALPAPPLCQCAHFHCAAWCSTWSPVHASCGRIAPIDEPNVLAAPCAAGEHLCAGGVNGAPCVHVHCELCGIGMDVDRPYIAYAHVSLVANERTFIRHEWGWRCPDCVPMAAREAEPSADELAANALRDAERPRGCPRCACDVEPDGDWFRCAGLTAEADRERSAVLFLDFEALDAAKERPEGRREPWVMLKRPTAADVAAAMTRIVRGGARAPCRWRGPSEHRGILFWRERRRSRGRPLKTARTISDPR